MNDRLAEFLYATWCSASDKVAGGDVANWASLPIREREVWQAVAGRARAHVKDQLAAGVKAALERTLPALQTATESYEAAIKSLFGSLEELGL